MIVTFWKGVFVADSKPEDRVRLKRAGFELHEPTMCEDRLRCRACKARIGRRYWTTRLESATRVRQNCNKIALGVLQGHIKKLRKSRATTSNIVIPRPASLSDDYKDFQKAGVAYAVERKDTLIADEMGLGKTVQALGFINYVRPQTVLVVCPASLIENWRREAEKWLVDDYLVFTPKNGGDPAPQTEGRLLVLTNYEKLVGRPPRKTGGEAPDETDRNLDRLFSGKEEPRSKRGEPPPLVDTPFSASLRRPWETIVFDEAHNLKNPDSLRGRAVFGEDGLFQRGRRRLFLSGTPMENYPREMWPIAASVCPQKFGDWYEFAKRYCGLHSERRNGRSVVVTTGATHLPELQQRLRASFMVRRLKADVLKELPPKIRQLIVLESEEWRSDPAYQEWLMRHEGQFDASLARLEAARSEAEYREAVKELDAVTGIAFTEMSAYRHRVGLAKLPACLRCVDEFLEGGLDSIVIFAHHADVLQKILEHYGPDAAFLSGETKMSERDPVVMDFQNGKYKIMVASLRAAGVGFTLTRSCTAAFFESDWNPAKVMQAEDRICRIGQKRTTHIIQFALKNSMDVNMLKKIVTKQKVIDRALDWLPESERMTQT